MKFKRVIRCCTRRELRRIVHSIEMSAKKNRKEFWEVWKSKHIVPLDLNYGHKTWSICTDRIAAAECATSLNEIEELYNKWGRK